MTEPDMQPLTEKLFHQTFTLLLRHPRQVGLTLLVLALMAVAALPLVPFEGGLEIMLPEGSEARRSILFLRDSEFADKVAFSIAATRQADSPSTLPEIMNQMSELFEQSPLIERVVRMPATSNLLEELIFFLDNFDQLAGPGDMELLQERLEPTEIEQSIRRGYLQMLKPESAIMQQIIRRDPLAISSIILQKIQQLSQSLGYRTILRDGHLMHPEEERGLLLLETGIPVTDTVGSRQLVAFLTQVQQQMPEGFNANFVCGHQRSVSNERLLRRDIRLTVSLASLAFLALFLVVFQDYRAVVIFLMPLLSILLSIHLSSWLMGQLSYLIIGFGAVMAGIAVDYGIHVYVAIRQSHYSEIAVRRLLPPITLGGLTTISVFLAFAGSAIPGYRQLAGFAVISIALSIVSAIFLLPPLLDQRKTWSGKNRRPETTRRTSKNTPRRFSKLINSIEHDKRWPLFFWLALPIAAGLAMQVGLDTELTRLDGTERWILKAEEQFQKEWSEQQYQHAMAVVTGKDYETAAKRNDQLYQQVTGKLTESTFVSLTPVWPSAATRAANQARWREFWTRERIDHTENLIEQAAKPYGFAANAFDPFFELLEGNRDQADPQTIQENVILQQLQSRFVQTTREGVKIISFFPDNHASLSVVSTEIEDIPEAFIVSMQTLTRALAEATAREAILIASIAMSAILMVVLVIMRDPRKSLAALLPAATGVLWLLAIMRLVGLTVNVANMIAGIVVVGLSVDYGIFMVHGWQAGNCQLGIIRKAVCLSATTTIMGTSVLLFARHPALFSIGITMTVGVATGFAAALLGVPGTCRWLGITGQNRQPREQDKQA